MQSKTVDLQTLERLIKLAKGANFISKAEILDIAAMGMEEMELLSSTLSGSTVEENDLEKLRDKTMMLRIRYLAEHGDEGKDLKGELQRFVEDEMYVHVDKNDVEKVAGMGILELHEYLGGVFRGSDNKPHSHHVLRRVALIRLEEKKALESNPQALREKELEDARIRKMTLKLLSSWGILPVEKNPHLQNATSKEEQEKKTVAPLLAPEIRTPDQKGDEEK